MSTPYSDANRLSLLNQLFCDIGPLFQKPHFATLVRFAFRREPGSSSFDLIKAGPKDSASVQADFTTSTGSTDASRQLVSKVLEVVKLLKLSETEKLVLLISVNEVSACGREVDLIKCQFLSSSDLTHYLLSQLSNSVDPKATDLLNKIKEGMF